MVVVVAVVVVAAAAAFVVVASVAANVSTDMFHCPRLLPPFRALNQQQHPSNGIW